MSVIIYLCTIKYELYQFNKILCSFVTAAVCLLFISSTVSMAVPFALGRVIDIIYTKESSKTSENLKTLCLTLTTVFILGALCNFGRVYLMNLSGKCSSLSRSSPK